MVAETTIISSRGPGSSAAAPSGAERAACPRAPLTANPGDPLARLAALMPAVELVLAYPGVWLRPDIYATHGHYLDCHHHVATFECLARAVSERLTARPRQELPHAGRLRGGARAGLPSHLPGDAIAARAAARRSSQGDGESLGDRGRIARSPRGWPGAAPRRRRGLGAMAQVVDGLELDANYVIFGHLHTPGPSGGDGQAWRTGSGTRLVNSGCWVYDSAHLGANAAESPSGPEPSSWCVTRVHRSYAGCSTGSPERSFALGSGDTARNSLAGYGARRTRGRPKSPFALRLLPPPSTRHVLIPRRPTWRYHR